MTAWIRMIPLEEATGTLAAAYAKVTTPHGTVDNVMKAHSLRPHTMEGHVALYRSVLHTPDNTLPFWFLEVIASYTSSLNQCLYSFTHHFTNDSRAFYMTAFGTKPHICHLVQNSSMYWF